MDQADGHAVALLGIGSDTTGAAIMVLRELDAPRRALPIWIGEAEAQDIGILAQGARPDRPLTHQLIAEVIAALGQRLIAVIVAGLVDGVFHAELVLDGGARVSARPSDAVPVALMAGAPIYAAASVLERAGVAIETLAGGAFSDPTPTSGPGQGPAATAPSPGEIDQAAADIRAWLDGATAADFTLEAPRDDDPDRPERPPGSDDPDRPDSDER